LLYNLVVNANSEVMANGAHREREYVLLLGFLSAEMRAGLMKHKVEILRLLFLNFIETVIVLDAAIAQIGSERLGGQPVLFARRRSIWQSNCKWRVIYQNGSTRRRSALASPQIELEKLRDSLQSEIDRQNFYLLPSRPCPGTRSIRHRERDARRNRTATCLYRRRRIVKAGLRSTQ
jgi:hypothetical protein